MLVSVARFTSKTRLLNQPNLKARLYSTQANGEVQPQLLNKTYQQLIEEQLKSYPHKDVMRSIQEDYRWTFADVLKHQDSVAAGILDWTTKREPYAVSLPLRAEAIMSQLGTARAVVPLALLKPGVEDEVLESQLKAVNPSLFVWPARIHKTVQLDQIYRLFPRLNHYPSTVPIYDKRFPALRFILQLSRQDLDGLYAYGDSLLPGVKEGVNRVAKDNLPSNPNTIIVNDEYKQVLFSQHNLINTGYLTGHRAGLNEEDIVLTTLQPSTTAGLSLGVGLALSHKLKLVWGHELFEEEATLSDLESDYCTVLLIQPNNLQRLLNKLNTKNLPTNLRKIIVVSSPGDLPTENLLTQVREKIGAKVMVAFGTNETGGVITTTSFECPDVLNLVGKALPHTHIQIVDKNGKQLPADTPGELTVKGFNVTSGFLNDPEYTNKKIKNGYLQTGITAKIDQNNNLFIL